MATKKNTTAKTTETKETAKSTAHGVSKVTPSTKEESRLIGEKKSSTKTPETAKTKVKDTSKSKKTEPVQEVKATKVEKKASDLTASSHEKVTKAKKETKVIKKTETPEVLEKPVEHPELSAAVEKPVAETKEAVKSEKTSAPAPHDIPVQHKPEMVIPVKGYSKEDLEHFREIIIAKKNEIYEQLQNLKEQMLDPTTGEYINENSPYSLHMAEQGTDAMEREKTFLYAQRENKFLGYLDEALKRIDAGTYGICIECIDEPQHLCPTCPLVPKARLEAVPHSQLCVPIKMRQEKKK